MPQLSPMLGFAYMVVVLILLFTYLVSMSSNAPMVEKTSVLMSSDSSYTLF